MEKGGGRLTTEHKVIGISFDKSLTSLSETPISRILYSLSNEMLKLLKGNVLQNCHHPSFKDNSDTIFGHKFPFKICIILLS